MGDNILLRLNSRSVFLNSFVHMQEYTLIVLVDMKGKISITIHKPRGAEGSIHQAQGHLCLCTADIRNMS